MIQKCLQDTNITAINSPIDNGAYLPTRGVLCNQIKGFAPCVKVGFSLEFEGLCATKAFSFFFNESKLLAVGTIVGVHLFD